MLLLLLACGQEKIPLDDSDTGTSITDSEDSSTTDSGDTGTPTGTKAVFDLSGEWGGTVLSLTAISFDEAGTVHLGEHLGTSLTAAEVTVYLPEPTEVMPNPDDPSVSYELVVASLHRDDDGDGYPSGFEVISGVGTYWLLYWDGPVPPDLAQAGVVEGWNVYEPNAQIIGDLLAIPVEANMVPNDHIAVAGGYSGSEDLGTLRMLLYPQAQAVHPVASVLYEGAMSDPWAIDLEDPAPSDHLFDADGTELAMELPLVYLDADASGGPTEPDTALYNTCIADGSYVGLIYLPEVTSLETAIGLSGGGIHPGWIGGAFDASDNLTILESTQLLTLSLCPTVLAN